MFTVGRVAMKRNTFLWKNYFSIVIWGWRLLSNKKRISNVLQMNVHVKPLIPAGYDSVNVRRVKKKTRMIVAVDNLDNVSKTCAPLSKSSSSASPEGSRWCAIRDIRPRFGSSNPITHRTNSVQTCDDIRAVPVSPDEHQRG